MNVQPPPPARRGRKPLLSREAIVQVALQLIGSDGVEAVTLRSLARKLSVTPMTLYHYFASRDELMSCVFDAFVAQHDALVGAPQDWEGWVEHVLRYQCNTLIEEPGWIPYLVSFELGSASLDVSRKVEAYLGGLGLTEAQAKEFHQAMLQVTIGVATLEIQRRGQSGVRAVLKHGQLEAGVRLLKARLRELMDHALEEAADD